MNASDEGSNGVQTLYDHMRWPWIGDDITELIDEYMLASKAVEKSSAERRQLFRACVEIWIHRLLLLVEEMNNFPKINT